ncbi:TRAP transporter permease [Alkalihalobacillus oceani]|uniref:TRAP transporter permease n=1 Tax=Halalkalibacter oceani TaxID=1653776 RepID=A0A9X2IRM8_9BACI|nr:TRAP transporter permease [Halalkalibacter oceani]MCM3715748.1 TRAP transporter permease [Halalkalibacter oceani]
MTISKGERSVSNNEGGIIQRQLKGAVGGLFFLFAICITLLHLYLLNFAAIDPWLFRAMHLLCGSMLGFALIPGWNQKNLGKIHLIDWLAILASAIIFIYIYYNIDQLIFRAGVTPTTMDFVIAIVGTLLVLELTRRTSGWSLPILSLIFIAYAFLGPYLPGILQHNGYSIKRFFSYIYGLDGIFGVTIDVSSKYILLFIALGAFLQASKVGDYFINFSFSAAGGLRGGPAKVSLLASGLMGMVSGTSAGNVVTTGSLTIPLMKRVGYKPQFAGATEAAASTGGQILPPIMGAGAFLMAEMIGISYKEIMIAAIIPALLYFVSVYFMIDLEAIKMKLRGLKRSELPKMKDLIKQAHLFIPIVVLISAILMNYSIIRSGTIAILACLVISWFSKQTRMGWKKTAEALAGAARSVVQLISICACAGIIVGVIALTGIGGKFANLLITLGSSSQLLALVATMILAIILGMGMPTTAAYAIAGSVLAPGLIQVGIEPLFAHMFIFYFAVLSAITPPVAVAAFAAGGIAGTDPFKTSLQAFKLGLAAFIVPYMFIYSPSILMKGSFYEIALTILTSIIGIYLLACAVQGYFFGKARWVQRIVLLIAALTLINGSIFFDFIGIALALLAFLINKMFPDHLSSQDNNVKF